MNNSRIEMYDYRQIIHRIRMAEADFVMANPPLKVDEIDAGGTVKSDPRLPFGLPGVNKKRKSPERQLRLDQLFLQLPQRTVPVGVCHVQPDLQHGPRRDQGPSEAHRDWRRGYHDRHPLQLLLYPHRDLRAVVSQPRQTRREQRQSADD